jgi:hypothetical protein
MKFKTLDNTILRGFLFGLSLCVFAACGDDTTEEPAPAGEEEGEESPEEEACEHMVEGPSTAATAGATPDAAQDITAEHTRVDITLVDLESGEKGGSVTYEAAEEAEAAIFLNKDIPLVITDAQGNTLEIEGSAEVTLCDEVTVVHTVDMPLGVATLTFGPTTEADVSVVIEAGEHEDE